MYEWLIANKELFKLVYALMIVLICIIIVLKTDKLFRLSLHNGIRYFRNAFFFYGIGFVIRYFLGSQFFMKKFIFNGSFLVNALFEFFLIMAGFFLLYSLIYKKFENQIHSLASSLFNIKILVFYLITFILVYLDYVWHFQYFMFFSQILIFILASIISYSNYLKNKKGFQKFYFLAMFFSLIAWSLNTLAAVIFLWDQIILSNIYLINAFVFLLILFGVIKLTN